MKSIVTFKKLQCARCQTGIQSIHLKSLQRDKACGVSSEALQEPDMEVDDAWHARLEPLPQLPYIRHFLTSLGSL